MISIELREWAEVGPATNAALRGVHLSDPNAKALAQALTRQGVLEITNLEAGLSVRSFSHVGRIELEQLTVTVRPKLAADALLELLRYAYSLRDLRLFDATTFSDGAQGLQDLLISQLEAEARELFHRGPTRRYVRRTEQLASPRGRLDVNRIARSCRPSRATLPCTYHPRSSDFLLNQIVRAGLELGRRAAGAPMLKRALAQTDALFAELATPIPLTDDTLAAARRGLDRLSSAYEPVLRLIELLHESSHLAFEEGRALRLKGFLFDMNRFFQTLLGKFLCDSLPDCSIQQEAQLRHMMAYAPGFNPLGRRAPRPRPDFVVTEGAQREYILDAKYRDLWRTELPREMLYQLAIYAMSQPMGSTAAILYPTEDPGATEAIVNISDPISAATRARVALRPVVMPRLMQLLKVPHVTTPERQHFAEALVRGGKPEARAFG